MLSLAKKTTKRRVMLYGRREGKKGMWSERWEHTDSRKDTERKTETRRKDSCHRDMGRMGLKVKDV